MCCACCVWYVRVYVLCGGMRCVLRMWCVCMQVCRVCVVCVLCGVRVVCVWFGVWCVCVMGGLRCVCVLCYVYRMDSSQCVGSVCGLCVRMYVVCVCVCAYEVCVG